MIPRLQDILTKRPELGLLSKAKLFAALKDQGITKKEIDDYLSPKELTQIYAKPQRNVEFKITSPPRSFQIDIALLPKYKKQNKGIAQFLICVDIISRKAFAYPLANGTMPEVIEKYKQFVKDAGSDHPIYKIESDAFFDNAAFRKLNTEQNILVATHVAKDDHITPVGNRLGIVDRCIRTLKQLIQKHMLSHNTTVWTDKLDDILKLYNDTPHSGIDNETPNSVYDDVDYSQKLYEGQRKKNDALDRKVSIMIGDNVRIMDEKRVFQKEKAPWTQGLYQVIDKIGYSYRVQDEAGVVLKRLYRPGELLVIKGDVAERLGASAKAKKKVEQEHKHDTRIARALGDIPSVVPERNKREIKRPARYA